MSTECSVLVNVLCKLEKNVYSTVVGWSNAVGAHKIQLISDNVTFNCYWISACWISPLLTYRCWTLLKWKSLSHVRLSNPTDYTVHEILQAGILEWVAFSFSRGSSQPRDWTQVSHTAGRFFTSWATREAQEYGSQQSIPSPVGLPNPGIKLGSPALQADSLPTVNSQDYSRFINFFLLFWVSASWILAIYYLTHSC